MNKIEIEKKLKSIPKIDTQAYTAALASFVQGQDYFGQGINYFRNPPIEYVKWIKGDTRFIRTALRKGIENLSESTQLTLGRRTLLLEEHVTRHFDWQDSLGIQPIAHVFATTTDPYQLGKVYHALALFVSHNKVIPADRETVKELYLTALFHLDVKSMAFQEVVSDLDMFNKYLRGQRAFPA